LNSIANSNRQDLKKLLTISFLLTCGVCSGQNLVPNPSFEDTLGCGTGLNPPAQSPPWFNPNIASPDYYSPYSLCGSSSINNPSGYQLAHAGNCYVGIYTYLLPNTHEYVEIKLLDSLQANTYYHVSFFVSRAEKFTIAADGMGAYFSNDSILSSTGGNFSYIPQVMNPQGNILYDTLNWMEVSGTFQAIGGEKFLTIGNFLHSSNTSIDTVPGGMYYSAYYYVDDISVTVDSSLNVPSNQNEVAVYLFPNPITDKLNVRVADTKKHEVIIYDITTRKLLQQAFTNSTVINTEQLADGVYYYEIKNSERTIANGKVLKQ
jgi:hypothetical protein